MIFRFFLLLLPLYALADFRQDQKPFPFLPRHNNQAPVSFESNSLKGSQLLKKIELMKKVAVFQDNMVIRGDFAEILFDSDIFVARPKIKQMNFKGNVSIKQVRVTSEVIFAKAKELSYQLDKNILIFEGDAYIKNHMETIAGEKILINIKTGQARIISATGILESKQNEKFKK